MAVCKALAVHLLLTLRVGLYIAIEQPSGSWAFKMGFMQTLLKSSKMFLSVFILCAVKMPIQHVCNSFLPSDELGTNTIFGQ